VTWHRAVALLVLEAGAVACSPGEDELAFELRPFEGSAVEGTATLSDAGYDRTRVRIEVEGSPRPLEARLRVGGCRGDDRFTLDVDGTAGDATAPYGLDEITQTGNAFLTVHGHGGTIVACGRIRGG
jgi:hypothetical protein